MDPYHVEAKTAGWAKVELLDGHRGEFGLDISAMLDAPAGKNGFVSVKDGHFAFEKGGRAKFFGVSLLYPSSYIEADRAEVFADRMARSGVNLVRLGDLDIPTGPGRSLFDDTRDDTKESARPHQRPEARPPDRPRSSCAGCTWRSNSASGRRLRDGDGVDGSRYLPAGGGLGGGVRPEAAGPGDRRREGPPVARQSRDRAGLKEEPAIAWITLAGELTLFDLLDETGRTVNEAAAIRP